jgi:hypothetical protein
MVDRDNMNLLNKSEKKLLSIMLASSQPQQMKAFLQNIEQTIANPDTVEVLVLIDENDDTMVTMLDAASKNYRFEVKYIPTPSLPGRDKLCDGYLQLLALSNQNSYFLQFLNDAVRFQTNDWDQVLANYVQFYDDHVFRLKASKHRYHNYYSHHECSANPASYSIMTRVWVEMAGRPLDGCSVESWHQHIDYHLGQTEGINAIPGLFRSVPIHDINLLSADQSPPDARRASEELWRLSHVDAQQAFRRIATHMAAFVWVKNKGLEHFEIHDDIKIEKFNIKDKSTELYIKDFYYHLSAWNIMRENFLFLMKAVRRKSQELQIAFTHPSDQHGNRAVRLGVLRLAKLLAPFMPRSESTPRFRQR